MAAQNNLFSGPHSVADYFDPDKNPPLPLIEIPDRLNPFRDDGVRIYAKMLTCLPAQNVKSLPDTPALKMLQNKPDAHSKKIVEASSGSTVLSLGIIARVLWGNEDVDAYVTNKKPLESLNMLRFFGIRPCLYGGLAQQEPTDPTGIMCRLRKRSTQDEQMVYPGQYDNPNNWKAHEEWTGPQIYKQLPQINIFCSTVGTGGAITGTGVYLKSRKPAVRVVGVFNKFGDPTPGPRHFYGFHTSGFPWQGTVDSRVEVSSVDSYRMSMRLSREGLIAGPSSGEALHGLLEHISNLKKSDDLAQFRDKTTGEVSCVFTCSDLPYQYLPGYFQKLEADEFPRIENEILLKCDQTRHDERWILDSQKAATVLFGTTQLETSGKSAAGISKDTVGLGELVSTQKPRTVRSWILQLLQLLFSKNPRLGLNCCPGHSKDISPSVLVLDFRNEAAFKTQHLPGSYSVPLEGLTSTLADGDLFGDAESVHMIWTHIQKSIDQPNVAKRLQKARDNHCTVMLICYNGDASRLASSTLRAMGNEAFSVQGGFEALWAELESTGIV
ncbi:cysteine synthase K/M:Cysteine synthase B [Colletotrichum truncatum]|uniref:Cysteine synthase K/M:Cysteine synthase B n=1 Tax=Colletotrichum truncatum TaxID=5467 RepID=A0ACC3YP47_COLTU|nr:cysteine synthase K/M:Cysteine synthase B [Colletotrichum truncatum]XP_036576076.1 cysteine synthase K/M:Cysteine synthase B [Colletotrichum truncatum]KAF6780823.1 cysteine synthase K/M:Cysteine synthase B [Colletotrichum truncatum]KAF6782759.1 cysteine synthase K/M:Cysteine synthase B [Colletotrichum truncatum]